jgi:hypothetical protein
MRKTAVSRRLVPTGGGGSRGGSAADRRDAAPFRRAVLPREKIAEDVVSLARPASSTRHTAAVHAADLHPPGLEVDHEQHEVANEPETRFFSRRKSMTSIRRELTQPASTGPGTARLRAIEGAIVANRASSWDATSDDNTRKVLAFSAG